MASLLSLTSLVVRSWDAPYSVAAGQGNPWIELHASLAIFSYAIFAIVALVAMMFLIQQHGLKKKQSKRLHQYLPSVQKLDLVVLRLSITGLLVLSAALVFGAIFWTSHPERVPIAKLLSTCLLWLGYLAIIILRLRKKLVTRRYALATIALFIFAIASLWQIQSAINENNDLEDSAPSTDLVNEQVSK